MSAQPFRRVTKRPDRPIAVLAAAAGALAVGLGLAGSLRFDTPSGPSVVVAALVLFLLSLLGLALRGRDALPNGGELPARDAQKGG